LQVATFTILEEEIGRLAIPNGICIRREREREREGPSGNKRPTNNRRKKQNEQTKIKGDKKMTRF
tara:strand:- start:210 stop:404 length:195 start_codon:yes stop_codon:yes gene_type:complete